jgi:hypothetical protein
VSLAIIQALSLLAEKLPDILFMIELSRYISPSANYRCVCMKYGCCHGIVRDISLDPISHEHNSRCCRVIKSQLMLQLIKKILLSHPEIIAIRNMFLYRVQVLSFLGDYKKSSKTVNPNESDS